MANLNEIIVSSHLEMQKALNSIQKYNRSIHTLQYSQHDALNPTRSAYQHLMDMQPNLTMTQIHKALLSVGFPLCLAERQSAYLSGGQAQLLALVLALHTQCHGLVIIDPFAAIAEKRIHNLKKTFANYSRDKPIWLLSYTKPKINTTSNRPSSSPLLTIEGLSVNKSINIISNLSLTIANQEIIGIVGDNGSGKSTLAQAIMQIIPYQGNIYLNQQRLCQKMIKRKLIQMLFQNDLFNPLVPLKNLLLEDFDQSIFTSCLEAFAIKTPWEDKYPEEIDPITLKSIALARLLARKPTITILDEPFSGMPVSWVKTCIHLLQQHRLTILIIEHNQDILQSLCHKVFKLEQGSLQ